MLAAKPERNKHHHRYLAVFCLYPTWFTSTMWFFLKLDLFTMYITRLKRFLEHMTVQYHLNSLQDLANSSVLNFRNKDNKKKLKPPTTTSAISICALYCTSSSPEIKHSKKSSNFPPIPKKKGCQGHYVFPNTPKSQLLLNCQSPIYTCL